MKRVGAALGLALGAALLAGLAGVFLRHDAPPPPGVVVGRAATEAAVEGHDAARLPATQPRFAAPREAVPEPLSPGRALLANPRPRPPARPWRVRGRVLDSSRRVIAGARVWIRLRGEEEPLDPRPTIADESGGFDIELPGPAPFDSKVEVVAEADGYQRAAQRAAPHRSEERVWESFVRLRPGRTLHGRVVLPSGAPVAGAEVRCVSRAGAAGAGADDLGPTRTGEDGRYAVGCPLDLDGFVVASKEFVGAGSLRIERRNLDADGALPDIALEFVTALAGRVAYPDGSPARHLAFELLCMPAEMSSWTAAGATDAHGRFERRDVLPGFCVITLVTPPVEESLRPGEPPRLLPLGHDERTPPVALITIPSEDVELVLDAHRVLVLPPLVEGAPAEAFGVHCVPAGLFDAPRYHDSAGFGHVRRALSPVGFVVAPEAELVVEVVVRIAGGELRAFRRLTVPHRPYETEVRLDFSSPK